jgi:tRNA nucleotidyltransferase/poly(A) polymerase
MNNDIILISEALATRGYTLWQVGGSVRDQMLGIVPKDFDFATDAQPDVAMEIYRDTPGATVIPTGLQHGTITVMLNGEGYEITTLRIDVETDGRHAEVAFTDSIVADLARRDLTCNSMARTMDGTLIDPFGGEADLKAGIVRFVGDAGERMREDYLRILRYFRFAGRFAKKIEPPEEMWRYVDGLNKISGERIWMEFSKIISGPQAVEVIKSMDGMGVLRAIGLVENPWWGNLDGMEALTSPATRLGLLFTDGEIARVSNRWKLSTVDRMRAVFVAKSLRQGVTMESLKKARYIDGIPLDWIRDVAVFNSMDIATVETWEEIPRFPVKGFDVMERFSVKNRGVGVIMDRMKERWVASDYQMTADELMETVD